MKFNIRTFESKLKYYGFKESNFETNIILNFFMIVGKVYLKLNSYKMYSLRKKHQYLTFATFIYVVLT